MAEELDPFKERVKVLTEAAKAQEELLFGKTFKKLTADEIVEASTKMSSYVGTIEYFSHLKMMSDQRKEKESKIIKPGAGLSVAQ